MNKTLLILLLLLSLGLAAYNVTMLDFENLFEGNSLIACIGIMASLCAVVLLLVFWTSKRIQEKIRKG